MSSPVTIYDGTLTQGVVGAAVAREVHALGVDCVLSWASDRKRYGSRACSGVSHNAERAKFLVSTPRQAVLGGAVRTDVTLLSRPDTGHLRYAPEGYPGYMGPRGSGLSPAEAVEHSRSKAIVMEIPMVGWDVEVQQAGGLLVSLQDHLLGGGTTRARKYALWDLDEPNVNVRPVVGWGPWLPGFADAGCKIGACWGFGGRLRTAGPWPADEPVEESPRPSWRFAVGRTGTFHRLSPEEDVALVGHPEAVLYGTYKTRANAAARTWPLTVCKAIAETIARRWM